MLADTVNWSALDYCHIFGMSDNIFLLKGLQFILDQGVGIQTLNMFNICELCYFNACNLIHAILEPIENNEFEYSCQVIAIQIEATQILAYSRQVYTLS